MPLVIRYPQADKRDLQAIRDTPLRTSAGGRVLVSAVADVREDRSPNFISRENVTELRHAVVQGSIDRWCRS